jgi:hypothetical protein
MTTHTRWLVLGMVALTAGLGLWVSMSGAAADDDAKATVSKIAAALEKDDKADAQKQAAALASKAEIEDVMHVFSLRRSKGLGVGSKPGTIMPDGIEAKIMDMAKKPMDAKKLAEEADALVQMGYVAAAVGQVAHAKPPEKDEGKKKKSDWLKWSKAMNEAALEFATTVKGKKPADVHKAALKLNASCTNCHTVFKDE